MVGIHSLNILAVIGDMNAFTYNTRITRIMGMRVTEHDMIMKLDDIIYLECLDAMMHIRP